MQTSTAAWRAVQEGKDPEAREALTLSHLRLVKHVVSQVMRSTSVNADFDDLVSAGTIGLMNAIDNFDPSRGLAFSTFAAPRIRGSVLDDLRRRDHVPRTVRRRQRQMSRAQQRLSGELGRTPSDEEMAGELDIDVKKLWRWERDTQRTEQVSFDQPVSASSVDGPKTEELIAGDDADDIELQINRREEIQILRDEILALKEQERVVLSLYYFEELKLHEIGSILGVTESRVSQIRSKAISNLQSRMARLREAV